MTQTDDAAVTPQEIRDASDRNLGIHGPTSVAWTLDGLKEGLTREIAKVVVNEERLIRELIGDDTYNRAISSIRLGCLDFQDENVRCLLRDEDWDVIDLKVESSNKWLVINKRILRVNL